MSLRAALEGVGSEAWAYDRVRLKPIETEKELAYAIFECRLSEEQQALVNPAGFSIGRAYLFREDNCPCIIYDENDRPIGFINLCRWLGNGEHYSWSFFIDEAHQGRGYGRCAAQAAVRLLKSAAPETMIKLSAEKSNERAMRLYASLGFKPLPEKDGDDLVFGL